jgi:hypothetical protein
MALLVDAGWLMAEGAENLRLGTIIHPQCAAIFFWPKCQGFDYSFDQYLRGMGSLGHLIIEQKTGLRVKHADVGCINRLRCWKKRPFNQ